MSGQIPGIVRDHEVSKKADTGGMPVRFRICKDPDSKYCASGQPDMDEYHALIAKLIEKGIINNAADLFVIDLREEEHCFLDGIGVEFDQELPDQVSISDYIEEHLPILSMTYPAARAGRIKREEEFVKETLGATYAHVATPDHGTPPASSVDKFLNILKDRPGSFVYIHCHGGKGRTSTYAAMLVLVRLHQQGKLDTTQTLTEILNDNLDKESCKKLFKVGAKDDGRASSPTSSDEDATPDKIHARLEFLERFYGFIRSGAYQEQSWSAHNKDRPAA